MSVPGVRPIGGAIGGLVVGFVVAFILAIPTCFVAAVATNSMSRADQITSKVVNPLPFIGAVIGFLIGLGFDVSETRERAEAERKRTEAEAAAERERRESERQKYVAEQIRLRGDIVKINEDSLSALEQLPDQLRAADAQLDNAEANFAKGAFVPFWESVEKAAFALGGFEERVRTIEQNSSRYLDVAKRARKYEIDAPAFAVSVKCAPKLRIASEASTRLSEIVDKAQCNFEFSQTYLQIRTNQILVAGFRNLAHALEEMTWRIASSIDDLASSVDSMGANLDDSLRKIHVQEQRIAGATEGLRSEAASSSAREQKALEMLDNIQRRRHPSVISGGLR